MPTDPRLAEEICLRMLDGESLKAICQDEHMPTRRTVFRWLIEDAEFQRQYETARQMLADLLFDEIKDIADDGRNDFMQRLRDDGQVETVVDHENIHRSKLRVDTRKWMASKLLPRKYGDRIGVELTTPFDAAAALSAARRRAAEGVTVAAPTALLPAPIEEARDNLSLPSLVESEA